MSDQDYDDKHPNIEEKGSDIEEDTKPSPEGGKPVNNSSTKERTLISKAQIAGIAEGVKMPRRFKSAFIIYSSMRHSQIKKELASKGFAKKTTDIAKILSQEWKKMSPADKAVWEEKSREDKQRYDAEKAFFKFSNRGKASKRIMKDPDAPKRPMSAFLAFSNERRSELKKLHPGVSNGGLSKILSQQWKEISAESKAKYVKNEAELRAKYKVDMAEFRKKKSVEAKMSKKLEDAVEVKKMEEMLLRKADTTEQDMASPNVQQAAGLATDGVSCLRAYQNGDTILSSMLGAGADVAGLSNVNTNLNSQLLFGGGGYGVNPSRMGVSRLDQIAALSHVKPTERLALALSHQQLLDRLETEQRALLANDLQHQHMLQSLQGMQNRSTLEQALAGNVHGLEGLYQSGYASMEPQYSADTHHHYSLEAQRRSSILEAQRRSSSLEAQRRSSLEAQHRSGLETQHHGFGHRGSSGYHPYGRYD